MVVNKAKVNGREHIMVFSATKSINSLRELFVARYPNGKTAPVVKWLSNILEG